MNHVNWCDLMPRNAVRIALVLTVVAFTLLITYYVAHQQRVLRIRISTTTSLHAAGLLDYIAEEFTGANPGVRVEFIAVGTGAALRMAERGDVCAVLTHDPGLEKQYLENGVIGEGRIFAYSYFILVGPADDPANASGVTSIIMAFKMIFKSGEAGRASFVSRGDGSGTHARELRLWSETGLNLEGATWYKDCGCGASEALIIADELGSYTLSDLGTYLTLTKAGRLQKLKILYLNESDPMLINIYSVYVANRCYDNERKYAEYFVDFLSSNQEELLRTFNTKKYGTAVFLPASEKEKELKELWTSLASQG